MQHKPIVSCKACEKKQWCICSKIKEVYGWGNKCLCCIMHQDQITKPKRVSTNSRNKINKIFQCIQTAYGIKTNINKTNKTNKNVNIKE